MSEGKSIFFVYLGKKRKIILGIKRGKKWENENLGKIIGA
jgi:hypothetical protein